MTGMSAFRVDARLLVGNSDSCLCMLHLCALMGTPSEDMGTFSAA